MKDVFGAIIGGLIIGIGTVGIVVLFAVIMGFPVMWCWNYVVPSVLNLPTITLDKAIVLNVLCGLLFKNHVSSSKK